MPHFPQSPRWRIPLLAAMVLAIVVAGFRSDLKHLKWVSALSSEGSPPPSPDLNSVSGYKAGQHPFLGFRERGVTYRWITATQDLVHSGPRASRLYTADELPNGRPLLLPQLQSAWLATLASTLHLITGESTALSVERSALWEPVLVRTLGALAVACLLGRWFGGTAAVAGTAGFLFFPPLAAQFLSGVLTTRTNAMLLAAYALSLHLGRGREAPSSDGFSVRGALATGLSLWLEPAIGFPVVVLGLFVGMVQQHQRPRERRFLTWSLTGFALTFGACLADGIPWKPEVTELRYLHPLYSLAWLGIGLVLTCVSSWQERRNRALVLGLAGMALSGGLVYVQIARGFPGWLLGGGTLLRLTSLDETVLFHSLADWALNEPTADVVLTLIPIAVAGAALLQRLAGVRGCSAGSRQSFYTDSVIFAGVMLLTLFRVRWLVPALLVSLPLVCDFVRSGSRTLRRASIVLGALFIGALALRSQHLPVSLNRPAGTLPPYPQDFEALIHRQLAQWLKSRVPDEPAAILAPPELSDSLVFHGNFRVLMSTAWESYPGRVAASRVLSAPESSEAEAVLQGRGITHVVIPLWDNVLPLLVRGPASDDKATLYARLRRWVFPPYLRPVAYHLPRAPGYEERSVLIYRVTASQDEGLALSRLAEYFLEMGRSDLAGEVRKVLENVYRDDPNATIARALIHQVDGKRADFEREFARLIADAESGDAVLPWDRRVQRAIVFALGKRPDLARPELAACVSEATRADLLELTPLQAYRLRGLASRLGLSFSDPTFPSLLDALGADFSPVASEPPPK